MVGPAKKAVAAAVGEGRCVPPCGWIRPGQVTGNREVNHRCSRSDIFPGLSIGFYQGIEMSVCVALKVLQHDLSFR